MSVAQCRGVGSDRYAPFHRPGVRHAQPEGISAEGAVKETNRHGIRIADFGPQRVHMAVHLGVTDADTRALCLASQASLGTDMHDQQKSETA